MIYYELLQPYKIITGQCYKQIVDATELSIEAQMPSVCQKTLQSDHSAQQRSPTCCKSRQGNFGGTSMECPTPPAVITRHCSDFHLFWSRTHVLAEQHFTTYEEAKKWVGSWIV
ncbi:hypothetical protein X975_06361, partial [Stegodyphus mimosarum]